MKCTFDVNTRYQTGGVHAKIPGMIRLIVWDLLTEFVNTHDSVDYLQIFIIEYKDTHLKIKHYQEVDGYEKIHEKKILLADDNRRFMKPFKGKVWVIDDVTHSTMLLPGEY